MHHYMLIISHQSSNKYADGGGDHACALQINGEVNVIDGRQWQSDIKMSITP